MSEEETDRSESGSEESEPDRSVEPPTYTSWLRRGRWSLRNHSQGRQERQGRGMISFETR